MANDVEIIQFGTDAADFSELFADSVDYRIIEADYLDASIDDKTLFTSGGIEKKFRDCFFFITSASDDIVNTLLKALPANRIFLSIKISVDSKEFVKLSQVKDIHKIDFYNAKMVADLVNRDLFHRPLAYKINMEKIAIDPQFQGSIMQQGHNFIELKSNQQNENFVHVASWREMLPLFPNRAWDINVESQVCVDATVIKLSLKLINPSTNRIEQQKIIDNDHLSDVIKIDVPGTGGFLSIDLFIKGDYFDFKIGAIHARQSREGLGVMLPSGNRLVDDSQMNEEILYDFNAGDLRPPLNVYFSGFNVAEALEGQNMMRDFSAPFLLVEDPRILGGSFYTGSSSLQKQIVALIVTKLKLLGFTSDDLILSGLSMGTYAALYFSTKLTPHAVIVGKPLANIGTIAANGRINRPDDFKTAFDILLALTGNVNKDAVKQANDDFWNSFRTGNYTNSKFVIGHMNDDDYDSQTTEELIKFLRSNYPRTPVIQKGLIGRHNDNTSGIVNWFIHQYKNVLQNDFDRKLARDS